MRKFAFGIFDELVIECKRAILNNNIDISKLVEYIQ